MRNAAFLLFTVSMAAHLSAIEIQIDYTYDTNDFFHPTNHPERRVALEAAAAFFEEMINDSLPVIDNSDFPGSTWTAAFLHPTSGDSTGVTDLVVPEDTIIIYVGARELGGDTAGLATSGYGYSGSLAWEALILARGQSGALDTPATDFGPWGGSISFDTPRTWNFSLTSNGSTSDTEFLNVALHEIAHILGIGASDAWGDHISAGTFTGAAATKSNNNTAPNADSGHYQNNLTSEQFGSFGATHGASVPVLMLPSTLDNGSNFDVATDLDLAALIDIGWELSPETGFRATALSPSEVTLNWNTVSFKEYLIQRAASPSGLAPYSSTIAGDGGMESWSDPAPLSDRAFYQLVDTTPAAGASVAAVEEELDVDPSVTVSGGRDIYVIECQ
jgi:hypothetical protein